MHLPDTSSSVPSPAPAVIPEKDPESWSELAKTAVIALLLALLIRSFLYDPFNIPSGSMLPTLQIGDYLFVSKRDYGYGRYSFPFGVIPFEGRIWAGDSMPQRGDIIVFHVPHSAKNPYIKRIIGLPGDRIQMINGRLILNGVMVPREPVGYERIDGGYGQSITVTRYLETMPGGVVHDIYEVSDTGPLDNTIEYVVPAGQYFAMGDNRDNSGDSRVMDQIGFIPWGNIIGRAEVIFFSTNGSAHLWEVWKWPMAIRYDRMFDLIGPPAVTPMAQTGAL
jgi:signal peptidase I